METYNNNSIESGKSNGRQMMMLLIIRRTWGRRTDLCIERIFQQIRFF
jgi:hypothetical protein